MRHKEQVFDSNETIEAEEFYIPSKLRLDESTDHLTVGVSFVSNYDEKVEDLLVGTGVSTLSKSETWTVEANDVAITVPTGTFQCIQIRKANAATGSDKRFFPRCWQGTRRAQRSDRRAHDLLHSLGLKANRPRGQYCWR